MPDSSAVLLDNTTIAGAGRCIYSADQRTMGGRHAQEYYSKFPDAPEEDSRSLAEFLTTLVLFDQVKWEGSSWRTQESNAMSDSPVEEWDPKSAWVYSWFPAFSDANDLGVLQHHVTKDASKQLNEAQYRAARWVFGRVQSGTFSLPKNFRVPLSYGDENHEERGSLLRAAAGAGLTLHETNIPLALFLARGLYYQSVAFLEKSWSYLPHSFRASLLFDWEQQFASLLCAVSFKQDAKDVLDNLNERFLSKVTEVASIKPKAFRTVSIGAAFLYRYDDPKLAFEQAIEFRQSAPGRDVRERFRAMIAAASKGSSADVSIVLDEIDKELKEYSLHKCGRSADSLGELKLLAGSMGVLKNAVEAAAHLLPTHIRTEAIKLLYMPLTQPTGFQLLFGHYIPAT
jgi:hypothetical protein